VLARSVVWRIRARRCCVLDGILGALVEWYCACAAACGIERRVAVRRRGAFVRRACDILGVVMVGEREDDGWLPQVCGLGVKVRRRRVRYRLAETKARQHIL
jgi:hypothetical protein